MQTKLGSSLESLANLLIGMVISIAATFAIFPLFGYEINLAANLGITCCFTVISFCRSYVLRRVFNKLNLFRKEEV